MLTQPDLDRSERKSKDFDNLFNVSFARGVASRLIASSSFVRGTPEIREANAEHADVRYLVAFRNFLKHPCH